jgi:hypothetical protein
MLRDPVAFFCPALISRASGVPLFRELLIPAIGETQNLWGQDVTAYASKRKSHCK